MKKFIKICNDLNIKDFEKESPMILSDEKSMEYTGRRKFLESGIAYVIRCWTTHTKPNSDDESIQNKCENTINHMKLLQTCFRETKCSFAENKKHHSRLIKSIHTLHNDLGYSPKEVATLLHVSLGEISYIEKDYHILYTSLTDLVFSPAKILSWSSEYFEKIKTPDWVKKVIENDSGR